MKKVVGVFLVTMSLGIVLHAQEKEQHVTPTKEAKAGFEKQFPGVKDAKWEAEAKDYEVNFKQGKKEMSAVFAANGTLKETETEISVDKLPSSATTYIKQHYAGQKVKEAARIEKADGTVNYEAEINKKDVLFDASGKFIKEAKG
jgi:uncharacterized membrane protein YkoI